MTGTVEKFFLLFSGPKPIDSLHDKIDEYRRKKVEGAIQIIRDTFWPILDPPPPPCVIW